MTTLRILCLLLTTLLHTARVVSSLRCYECESLDEGGCGDPFSVERAEASPCDQLTSTWPRDLGKVLPGLELRTVSRETPARSFLVCAKTKFILRDTNEAKAVMRGCSSHGNDTCQVARDYLYTSGLAANTSEIICEICTTNECNVATSLKPIALTSLVLVAVMWLCCVL